MLNTGNYYLIQYCKSLGVKRFVISVPVWFPKRKIYSATYTCKVNDCLNFCELGRKSTRSISIV